MATLMMWEWRCTKDSCNTKYDNLAPSSEYIGRCPVCDAPSKRLISAPRMDPKMGVNPDSSMGDKWAKNLEKRHIEAARRKRDHGDEI